MNKRDFIKELNDKFAREKPDSLFIFDDIYTHNRKLAYCHWMQDAGIKSIDYQIIDNVVTQITAD